MITILLLNIAIVGACGLESFCQRTGLLNPDCTINVTVYDQQWDSEMFCLFDGRYFSLIVAIL